MKKDHCKWCFKDAVKEVRWICPIYMCRIEFVLKCPIIGRKEKGGISR